VRFRPIVIAWYFFLHLANLSFGQKKINWEREQVLWAVGVGVGDCCFSYFLRSFAAGSDDFMKNVIVIITSILSSPMTRLSSPASLAF